MSNIIKFLNCEGNREYKIEYIPPSKLQISGKFVMYMKIAENKGYSFDPFITIDSNPTGNCQLSIISLACKLSNLTNESLINVLKSIKENTKKSIIMIDVNNSVRDRFISILKKEDIILDQSYKNTNGNNMNILMFNTRNF